MSDHKELDAWKQAMALTKDIYIITRKFPKDEQYGIVSQIRRAAVSIPSNIAEGSARNSDREFIQFLYIAQGSLAELETQLLIAKELKYTDNNDEIFSNIKSIQKLIQGLIKYLKGKQQK